MSNIVQYVAENGQDITVTERDIRDLMAAGGNQAATNVTSQEIMTFMRLCQSQRLNPFTRDAYIVKYGNNPASFIAGKDAFVKRATRNPKFRGHEAGITILGVDGKLHRREGSMLLDGEKVVGGWCKVYVEGYEIPIYDEVSFNEYNTGKSNWSKMPATMIRKVALCHALREAFPEDLGGLYGAEEMDKAQEGQAPSQTPPQQQIEPVYEVESVEDVEDPRKTLWEQAVILKSRAVELGTKPEGIDSWMAANIVSNDGSPKPKKEYSAEDITSLCDFLNSNISAQELLKQEALEVEVMPESCQENFTNEDLADNDIPF